MEAIRSFFKPDWKKLLLFAVFILLMAGGGMQAWCFTKAGPKPFMYDLLSAFPLWYVWIMLSAPQHIISSLLGRLGVSHGPSWLFQLASLLYFYIFACLLVVSFRNYAARFGKWLWVAIVLAPLALGALGSFVPFLGYFSVASMFRPPLLEAVMGFMGHMIVVWGYLYLIVCFIFYGYDFIGRLARSEHS